MNNSKVTSIDLNEVEAAEVEKDLIRFFKEQRKNPELVEAAKRLYSSDEARKKRIADFKKKAPKLAKEPGNELVEDAVEGIDLLVKKKKLPSVDLSDLNLIKEQLLDEAKLLKAAKTATTTRIIRNGTEIILRACFQE